MFQQIVVVCIVLTFFTTAAATKYNNFRDLVARLKGEMNKRERVAVYGEDLVVQAQSLLPDPTVSRRNLEKRVTGTVISMTASRKNTILNLHNHARATVSPPAAPPLQDMTWDKNLATIAVNYAKKCSWSHNSQRSDNYPGYVGENLALTKGSSADGTITGGINGWIYEKNYWTYNTFPTGCNPPPGKTCGHYTQMIWDDTIKIGCGLVSCPVWTNLGSYWNNGIYLVCNYAPGGNYLGEKPY